MMGKRNWPEHCSFCGGNGWTACEYGSYANCPGAQTLINSGVEIESYMHDLSEREMRRFSEELHVRGHHEAAKSLQPKPWWKFW